MKIGNIPRHKETSNSGFLAPPIPLVVTKEKVKLNKDEYLAMKLRSNPNDKKSPVYELTVPYFASGTTEEWFKFEKSLRKVFIGQGLTTGPTQFAMTRRLLTEESLVEFDRKAAEGSETTAELIRCLQAVTVQILPKSALLHQKRYMRRILRKPHDMTIRAYHARYQELNRSLAKFPPFSGASQKLPDDEVKEHLEFAIPTKWQKQMILQGFNAVDKTIDEFIEFCERLETSEDIFDSTHAKKHNKTQMGKSKNGNSYHPDSLVNRGRKSTSNKRKLSTAPYHCLYHGTNTTHNTDQCKLMKAQAS